jgi:hypothetical protein
MSPGRRVTDGLYRELCRGLLDQARSEVILEAHLDVAKFFDHIRRFPLLQAAAAVGYPLDILRVSMNTYAAERRIVIDEGITSIGLWGSEGILAGSPHAVYETVAYLALSIRVFQQLYPSPVHKISVFVDDLTLQVVQASEQQCVTSFTTACAWIISEFEHSLGLPIERDKTFVLSSSDEALRLAVKAMGPHAGQHGLEVRKLGATFSLQHRSGRRRVKARQTRDRVAKALARHRRIAALAGKRRFGTVFQTGVLQEAAFGAELSLMAPGDLDKLRIAAVRANGLQCMGVSHRVSLLALPLDRDPRWNIDCRIIGAFSREAWNQIHAPHLDHLTPKEFAGLYSLPVQDDVKYPEAWKDPVSTLRRTLKRLQITWKRPMVWEYKGMEMHLQAGTPALLPRLLQAGARQTQLAEAAFPGAPEGWTAPYLHSVLDSVHSKHALSTTGKKALLAYMSGKYPTRTVLAAWGYKVDIKCPHCGLDDTAFHRIWKCTVAKDAEGMTKRLKHWEGQAKASRGILVLPPPPRPQVNSNCRYTLFGRDCTAAQFTRFIPADGPVYIDGSALHGKTPFASAGWAAVQVVGGKISRSISAPLDPDFPASSDFAEHIACHFAASHARIDDPIEVVTDCSSVISYFQAAVKGTATAYHRPLGGVWADLPFQAISTMHKIKSHLSYEQATTLHMGQWWQGNAYADQLAQEAAAEYAVAKADAAAYCKQQRFASSFVRHIAISLTGWKGETVHPRDLPRIEQPKGRRVYTTHQYEWHADLGFWACRRCWKRRRAGNNMVDHSGCKAINPLEAKRVHKTHHLRIAHGPWGSRPLMFCTRCGHYSTARFAALVSQCNGKVGRGGDLTSAYRLYLRTIRRGRHPTLPRFVLGHQYTPHRQWGVSPEAAVLADDAAAAELVLSPTQPGPAELLAPELAELELLEEEAALANWETEEALALGEACFLGLDSP